MEWSAENDYRRPLLSKGLKYHPTPIDEVIFPPPPDLFPDTDKSVAHMMRLITGSTDQRSLPSLNSDRRGEEPASPSPSWDTIDIFSGTYAITMIQRVTTAEDVERVLRAFTRTPWLIREPKLPIIRLAAARLFSDTWDLACGKFCLDSEEQDVPHTMEDTTLTLSQMERPIGTTRGIVIARLYGGLFKVNILTGDEVVVACEMLLEHHQRLTHIQGLWELITSAGEEVCREATLQRMLSIQRTLKETERDSSDPEVDHYSDLIIQLIDAFVLVQAEKTKAADTEEGAQVTEDE
ncbi:hypothetical protein EW145_g7238 [Phellinidium pouzarii]|uniref:Uncharacterized protein n=1 Tax=Phellinidium pouzarii TaxID=167371 RepID=A0A4S4KN74_9AGAM|nr:hypothetical protein EW145_g7238 [Phellinidium pouzarii]